MKVQSGGAFGQLMMMGQGGFSLAKEKPRLAAGVWVATKWDCFT
jgi:hypothetical protein